MRVPIRLIAPLACDRQDTLARYTTMLRAGSKAPPIALIRQCRGSKYRYRLFDGVHRVHAAKRVGQKMIDAVIITVE